MREINLGFDFVAFGAGRTRGLALGLRFAGLAEVGPHLFRFMVFDRTGVSLFFSNADLAKHIEDGLAFDFQFSGQIVDSNLAHPPFCPPGLCR
jgi:hypothetical protein